MTTLLIVLTVFLLSVALTLAVLAFFQLEVVWFYQPDAGKAEATRRAIAEAYVAQLKREYPKREGMPDDLTWACCESSIDRPCQHKQQDM